MHCRLLLHKGLWTLAGGTRPTPSSAASGPAAEAERRKTYPAGRIMHLVPSRLVFMPEPVDGADGAGAGFAPSGNPAPRGKRRIYYVRESDSASSDQDSDSSSTVSSDYSSEDEIWQEAGRRGSEEGEEGSTAHLDAEHEASLHREGRQDMFGRTQPAEGAAAEDPVAAAIAAAAVRGGS